MEGAAARHCVAVVDRRGWRLAAQGRRFMSVGMIVLLVAVRELQGAAQTPRQMAMRRQLLAATGQTFPAF